MPRQGRPEGDAADHSDLPGDGDARPRPSYGEAAFAEPRKVATQGTKTTGTPPPHITSEQPVPPTGQSLQARADALVERYGPHGLHVHIEAPFVLVGDEGPQILRRRGEHTVRWAVTRLKNKYFDAPPSDIIEVWLLGDDASYRTHARAVFGDEPDTPYGYFSPTHRVLIMNIATGGGTLVHELVHPYIESNFPGCPSWFDEGLASLYEQCGDKDGQIWGMTNWRLAGLQETIEANALPSFETLVSTTRDEFYEQDPGSNYAQARYLCYYLQHKGQLRSFYRDFLQDRERDPSGIKTLRAHVGKDLDAFQRDWERWVMTLRYG